MSAESDLSNWGWSNLKKKYMLIDFETHNTEMYKNYMVKPVTSFDR